MPEGVRVYAIGDVHGRIDLLEKLARQIQADAKGSGRHLATVTLGDLIDRGPHSRDVVEFLTQGGLPGLAALCGNHEGMLLSALAGADVFEMWRRNGALDTLASYGVDVANGLVGRDATGVIAGFKRVLPPQHLAFFNSLIMSHEIGDYFFCHAGIRPGVPLDQQSRDDLMWIRDEFLNSQRRHGKIIVHGHTPTPEPEVRENRINIDTGGYLTGRLTCLVLDGTARAFLTT